MIDGRPRVEVLSFVGCPNAEPALALVRRVSAELGIDADVETIEVENADQADDLRFLGSPSIRVDGRDVEPGADNRSDLAFSCRVYSSESGLKGQPDERWLRDAFQSSKLKPTDESR